MKGNSGVLPRWTSGGVVISILMIMIMMMIRRVDAWTHSSSRQLLCRSTSLYLESSLHTVSSTDSSIDCTSKLWDEELPVGARCVALQLQQLQETNQKNWIPPGLHPLELEYGLQLTSFKTRNSFFLGRLALRQVLDTTEPILKDAYGRPRLPAGYVASISHKGNVGVVALLQPPMLGSIGVDLEYSQGNPNVARKVLTPREQECLGRISTVTPEEEVLLRFSMKESLYKAMHPYLCHYVGFQQVEVQPTTDGRGEVQLLFPNATQLSDVQIYWQRMGPYFLSSCRVLPVSPSMGKENRNE